ncbi:MAG: TssQ family T6SS-associated lipoprotein [Methylibium sp.]|uniref:TssQ family T6SS-associated lipoprotein n=1 Tax=Methylibium sp. TaxID=2067992 RepID=UPI001824B421|nr:TssQ family T6SS-associated lipoprotein [Methylibium sp.]MBA3597796.1 TssQ family T6SS-associated lipoprotein [Methylibium sp.]
MTARLQRPLATALLLMLAACAHLQPPAPVPQPPPTQAVNAAPEPAPPPAPEPAPPPAPPSIVQLASQPAEQALLAGLRAYDNGQYKLAERHLGRALKAGLQSPQDRAAANKTLAFVYCTSKRRKLCEAAFRAARSAEPGFALNKAEAGHPTWGPVYRRLGPPATDTR